jgi:hypothetical protein
MYWQQSLHLLVASARHRASLVFGDISVLPPVETSEAVFN